MSWLEAFVGRKVSATHIDFDLKRAGAIERLPDAAQGIERAPVIEVFRPLLTFRLINTENGLQQIFVGIIDTGAPYCLLPAWMGESVKHQVSASKERIGVQVAGAQNAIGWLHRFSKIQVMYREAEDAMPKFLDPVDCPVVFCPDFHPLIKEEGKPARLPHSPFALLGQFGFLDKYDLYFSQSKRSFSLVIP